jgi:hypothetical protein
MTRDRMNILMQGLTIGEMRRASRTVKGADEWDGCWPLLAPAGRTWSVEAVLDSDDIERAGPDLVPVEIVGTGATLCVRRCDPDHGCDAFIREHDAERRLPAVDGGAA